MRICTNNYLTIFDMIYLGGGLTMQYDREKKCPSEKGIHSTNYFFLSLSFSSSTTSYEASWTFLSSGLADCSEGPD